MSQCKSEVERIIASLHGQQAWGVSLGYGTFVTLEFGQPLAPQGEKAKVHGQWHLWIYGSAWRIEERGHILAGSQDDKKVMEKAVLGLDGKTLLSTQVGNDLLDAEFLFEDGLTLRVFGCCAMDMKHWMLFTPDRKVLSVGPGETWSHTDAEGLS
jgi:hypothetical protein